MYHSYMKHVLICIPTSRHRVPGLAQRARIMFASFFGFLDVPGFVLGGGIQLWDNAQPWIFPPCGLRATLMARINALSLASARLVCMRVHLRVQWFMLQHITDSSARILERRPSSDLLMEPTIRQISLDPVHDIIWYHLISYSLFPRRWDSKWSSECKTKSSMVTTGLFSNGSFERRHEP